MDYKKLKEYASELDARYSVLGGFRGVGIKLDGIVLMFEKLPDPEANLPIIYKGVSVSVAIVSNITFADRERNENNPKH